jgi:hypothetical protein
MLRWVYALSLIFFYSRDDGYSLIGLMFSSKAILDQDDVFTLGCTFMRYGRVEGI